MTTNATKATRAPEEPRPPEQQHMFGMPEQFRWNFTEHLALGVFPQLIAFWMSIGLVVGLLGLLGYAPSTVVQVLVRGAAGTPSTLSTALTQSVPLLLGATAVWLAFQTGLFNIGGDGQLQVGGLVALVVGLHLPSTVPAPLSGAIVVLVGAVGGAVWASVAGVVRAYRGSSEVISTIMLNFIAATGITLLINGPMRAATARYTARTDEVPDVIHLGDVVPGLPLAFVVALVLAALVILSVQRSRLGLTLRAVGLNGRAAGNLGLRVRVLQAAGFAVSGALYGIAGAIIIIGYRYYIAPGWAAAWGLPATLIAFLAQRTPMLIPVWAVVMGLIGAAGPALKGQASVPDSITTVMQVLPVVLLFVILRASGSGRRVLIAVQSWCARRSHD